MSNAFYKIAVLGAAASTLYFTGSTLMGIFSKTGTFHLIDESIKIIESDPECRKRIPPPLLASGNHPLQTNNRRSRPIPTIYVNKEGKEVSEMKFYLEGNGAWALIYMKSVEGKIEDLMIKFLDGKSKNLIQKPHIPPSTSFFKRWFNKLI
jgi:hypothetical protein